MMDVGMMWSIDDPKLPLSVNIASTAEFFMKKHGQYPNTCLVHPSMLAEPQMQVGRVTVRALRSILPGNLWIGVETPAPLACGHPPISNPETGGEGRVAEVIHASL